MVEFSIYANHGGGYSYRLCKDDGNPMTEDCYQKMPLDFATDMSTVHYWDGSKDDIKIQAVSTKVGGDFLSFSSFCGGSLNSTHTHARTRTLTHKDW